MEDLKQIVAANIIALRTNLELTQAELGEKLNYSDKSISKWERGEAIPDVRVLKEMAQIFGVTVDYLINDHNGEEPPSPDPVEMLKRNYLVVSSTKNSTASAWPSAMVWTETAAPV